MPLVVFEAKALNYQYVHSPNDLPLRQRPFDPTTTNNMNDTETSPLLKLHHGNGSTKINTLR